jgi:hypothetical protein
VTEVLSEKRMGGWRIENQAVGVGDCRRYLSFQEV